MAQERLNLYRIDIKYVRELHNADDKVSSVSPQLGKAHRVYIGIIALCNGRKYLIPLSHPTEKHLKMQPKADFDKIFNRKERLIGVLNYNLMIPVTERQLLKLDLSNNPKDSEKVKYYKQLCIDELHWCRSRQEAIVNKANVLYSLCTNDTCYKGKGRCLDFKTLEKVCDKYNSKFSVFSL